MIIQKICPTKCIKASDQKNNILGLIITRLKNVTGWNNFHNCGNHKLYRIHYVQPIHYLSK